MASFNVRRELGDSLLPGIFAVVAVVSVGCEQPPTTTPPSTNAAASAGNEPTASSSQAPSASAQPEPVPVLEPDPFKAEQPSAMANPATAQSCNLDAVAGAPVTDVVVVGRKEPVQFVGWAVDAEAKKIPPVVMLEIANKKKRYFATATRITKRADVAESYKVPAFVNSGFDALASLEAVDPGDYTVHVLQVTNAGKALVCDPGRKLQVQ